MSIITLYVHEAKPGLVLAYHKKIEEGRTVRFERLHHGVWCVDASEGVTNATCEAAIASGRWRVVPAVPSVSVIETTTLVSVAMIDFGLGRFAASNTFEWRKALTKATIARVSHVVYAPLSGSGEGQHVIEVSRWYGEASRVQHALGAQPFTNIPAARARYTDLVRECATELHGACSVEHRALVGQAIERSFDLGELAGAVTKAAVEEQQRREDADRKARAEQRERERAEREQREREQREREQREREERAAREQKERERAERLLRGDVSEMTDDELRAQVRAARRKAAS